MPKETSNISISEENTVEEKLRAPSDHVEQHQTVRDGPTKQNPIQKTIELPKPGQTIECLVGAFVIFSKGKLCF